MVTIIDDDAVDYDKNEETSKGQWWAGHHIHAFIDENSVYHHDDEENTKVQ